MDYALIVSTPQRRQIHVTHQTSLGRKQLASSPAHDLDPQEVPTGDLEAEPLAPQAHDSPRLPYPQRALPSRSPNRQQRRDDGSCLAPVALEQRAKVGLRKHVAVPHQRIAVAEDGPCIRQPARRSQDPPGFVHELDILRDAATERLRAMVSVHRDRSEARRLDPLDNVQKRRTVAYRQQRLGNEVRDRTQARSEAGAQHHRGDHVRPSLARSLERRGDEKRRGSRHCRRSVPAHRVRPPALAESAMASKPILGRGPVFDSAKFRVSDVA